jgi:hypothetical protein
MKAEQASVDTLPMEIGIVIAGKLDLVDRQSLEDAIATTESELTQAHQSAGQQFDGKRFRIRRPRNGHDEGTNRLRKRRSHHVGVDAIVG